MCYYSQCPGYVLDTVSRSVMKHWLMSRGWQVPVNDNAVFVFSCVSTCRPVAHPLSQQSFIMWADVHPHAAFCAVHNHCTGCWRSAPITGWAEETSNGQIPPPPTCLACSHFLTEILILYLYYIILILNININTLLPSFHASYFSTLASYFSFDNWRGVRHLPFRGRFPLLDISSLASGWLLLKSLKTYLFTNPVPKPDFHPNPNPNLILLEVFIYIQVV